MATIEYWIQIENHPWDVSPNHIDRMTGEQFLPTLQVAGTGATPFDRPMYKPLAEDALILRRYTANWAAPARW